MAVATAVIVGLVLALPVQLIEPLWHPAAAASADPLTPASPPASVDPPRSIVAQTASGPTVLPAGLYSISTDTVWGPQGSPYVVGGDLSVQPGVTLVLLPGTVVKFGGTTPATDQFYVSGQLLSLGTAADPVTITSYQDDSVGGDSNGDGSATSPAPGDWWGVDPNDGATMVLDYTTMRYGGHGSSIAAYGTLAIQGVDHTTALVSNSAIEQSANSGIYLYPSIATYLGVYNSYIGGIQGVSTVNGFSGLQLVNNVIPGSDSGKSVGMKNPGGIDIFRNDLGHGVLSSNIDGSPVTTVQLDVRYNLIGHGASLDIDSNASYAANWFGAALNPGDLPSCLTTAEKNARQDFPPLIWTQQPCGWTATGWQSNVTPALSVPPSRVPPLPVSEAQAPSFGPVNTATGALKYQVSDLTVLDAGKDITATRTYRSDKTGSGDAGPGWSTAFSEGVSATAGSSLFTLSDGSALPFDTDAAVGYIPALGVNADFQTGSTGTTITTNSQTTYDFNGSGELTSMLLGDPGHALDIDRTDGQLDKVTGVSGRYLDFVRSGGKLTGVHDGNGRSVGLVYADGRLTDVQGVDGQHERYEYDADGRLTKVTAPSGLVTLAAHFTSAGKVDWIEQAGEGRTTFAYDTVNRKTTLTRADGSTVVQTYDAFGQLVTEKLGGSTRHVVYNAGGGVIADISGLPDSPMTGYGPAVSINVYDKHGDLVRHVDGNNAATDTTYNSKHKPLVTTRADGKTVQRTYDANGRLSTVTDPAGKLWQYSFNSRGQVTGRTDPLNRTASVAYQSDGDLTSTTDELGATTVYGTDPLGRQTSATDALNHTTAFTYTAWDAQKTVTSARGGVTTYEYDADRRRTSVTDAAGGLTSYEYDTFGRPSATVDAEGGRTAITYDPIGQPTIQTDPRGHTTVTAYTPEGWIASVTDEAGKVTSYERDYAGRDYRVTDALDAVTQTAYDGEGLPTSIWQPDGGRTRYAYDVLGRQTQLTTPSGKLWKTDYDAVGNVIKVTDPLNHTTQATYDEVGRVSTRTDRVGTLTSYAYDDAQRKTTVSDTVGAIGTAKTDALGQVTSQTDALGAVETTTYDEDGNAVATSGPAGNWSYECDLLGRRTAAVDPLGHRTETEYDHLGRVKKVTYPDLTTRTAIYDPNGNQTEIVDRTGAHWSASYDARNLIETATDPLGHITNYSYDALGRTSAVVDPTGVLAGTAYDPVGRTAVQWDTTNASWITAYDLDGNVTQQTDPAGAAKSYTYDAVGNLKTVAAGGTALATYTYDNAGRLLTSTLLPMTYTYDARGRTKTVKNGTNNITSYDYDLANRLTTQISPLGHAKHWTYDAAGRVKTAADALGNTTRFDYDVAGHLTTLTLPRGGTYSFDYDADGRTLHQTDPLSKTTGYAYDGEGRPIRTDYPTGRSVVTEYDTVGRLHTVTAGGKIRIYGFDDAGRMTSAADPDAGTLGFAYNNRGLLATATDAFGDTSYGYDVAQRLAAVTPPTGSATTYAYTFGTSNVSVAVRGATNTNLLYNYLGRLKSRTPVAPSRTVGSITYSYDNAGRLTAFAGGTASYDPDGRVATTTDTLSGSAKTTTYGYDDADRLTSALVTQGTTQLSSTGYAWDADSNRQSVTVGSTTTDATYDLADRLISTTDGVSYSYDDDGRQLSAGPTAYGYNDFGELINAGAVGYGRDALGRLSTRISGTLTETLGYTGAGTAMNAWRSGTGPTTHVLSDADGGQLAIATDGAKTYRADTNLHGDLTRLRDDYASTADWAAAYDPFGTATWSTGAQPIPVPLGYQSDYTDPATGNVDMGARDYSPTTGRFTTSDTVVGSASNVATYNRYLYANANPLTYVDHDGHIARENRDGGTSTSGGSSSSGGSSGGSGGSGRTGGSHTATFHKYAWIADPWTVEESHDTWAHKVFGAQVGDFIDGMNTETGDTLLGLIHTFNSGSACLYSYHANKCDDFKPLLTKKGWQQMGESLIAPIEDCAKNPTARGCGKALVAGYNVLAVLDGGAGLAKATVAGARTAAVEVASRTSTKVAAAGVDGAAEAGSSTSRGLTSSLQRLSSKDSGLSDLLRKLGGDARNTRTSVTERPGGDLVPCHSFAPSTLVLMANGTAKAIKDVQIGDKVLASDPHSGKSASKTVTALHKNDDVDLADVTVTDTRSGKPTVLHTTWHHPFWNADAGGWTDAKDLKAGTHLLDADGRTAMMVTAVMTWTGLQRMRDLTVADNHTYYVVAGEAPVLVHNCDGEAIVHLDREAGHASITVRHGDDVLHTEQAGETGTRAVAQEFNGTLSNFRLDVRIPLPNASMARSFQDVTVGRDLGAYDEATRSCITYCAEVLQQGGVEGIPIEEGSIAITKWLIRQHG